MPIQMRMPEEQCPIQAMIEPHLKQGSPLLDGDSQLKSLAFALVLMAASSSAAFAQADSTVSRVGDPQLGGGYTSANSDYLANRVRGFNLYGDFDFTRHYGIEANFHQVSDPQPVSHVYERTYEIGGRYVYHYHRYAPYAKVLVGRGVFNFPPDCLALGTNQPVSCTASNVNPATTGSAANLAYNIIGLGGGLDVSVTRRINVRVDFEHQDWFGFQNSSLQPNLISVGVAYHFSGGPLSTQ